MVSFNIKRSWSAASTHHSQYNGQMPSSRDAKWLAPPSNQTDVCGMKIRPDYHNYEIIYQLWCTCSLRECTCLVYMFDVHVYCTCLMYLIWNTTFQNRFAKRQIPAIAPSRGIIGYSKITKINYLIALYSWQTPLFSCFLIWCFFANRARK